MVEKKECCVSVNHQNSTLFNLLLGTVKDLMLGPVLYAVFMAPMFDIENHSAFADDTIVPR